MAKSVIYLVIAFIALPFVFFLPKYVPYYWHEWNSPTLMRGSEIRLKYLSQLTEFPILGQLFQEQKVMELVVQHKYEEAIKSSEQAIKSPINQRSFSIWYHKALSECQLKKLQDCEESLRMASLYSNEYTDQHVENIYEILELYASQKVKKSDIRIQTTILEDHQIVSREAEYEESHDLSQL